MSLGKRIVRCLSCTNEMRLVEPMAQVIYEYVDPLTTSYATLIKYQCDTPRCNQRTVIVEDQ